ncbi:hypothetical protein [Ruminococcus sp.]|uniref:hypothetical protein n=1 Tax=Ruminococcus sp. TaxID=41978 RepID=UPI0025EBF2CD|nr:hypothetical protein [Ruminococcus sp.]
MSKKNLKKTPSRSSAIMKAAKVIMLLLTLYFSCAMTVLSGAGLIYNRASYGSGMAVTGFFLIFSAALMTAGAILCIFRKNAADILSIVFSAGGFILCMVMLYKLVSHADRCGWTDKYTLQPISSMYKARILPCIIPAAMAIAVALIQLFSYDMIQYRRKRRAEKEARENAPAPPIIED